MYRGIAIATSAHVDCLGIVVYPPIPTAARSTTAIPAETTPRAQRSLLRLVLAAPRLPERGRSMRAGGTLSVLIHASALIGLVLAGPLWRSAPLPVPGPAAVPPSHRQPMERPRIVFLQIPASGRGGGGGGGGNRHPTPPSRAQAVGSDRLTIPVARPVATTSLKTDSPPQQLVLDAKPLASGTTFVIGAPDAPAGLPFSQGPGSGGGVGEGTGTGIGSGTGSGIGPGSGGGSGGGVYRPGGSVVGPVLVSEVKPIYTAEALRLKIQGSVLLEAIIGIDGIPVRIRVLRPLFPGLDEAAAAAAREWRFLPGRIGNTPVDVLVTIQMDFRIH
jgi:TonB family protein